MNLPNTPDELDSNCKEILEDPSKWHSIPILNYTPSHKLKDQALVRFRGMVQDMWDPEIYLEQYEVKSTDGSTRLQQGKYRDCLCIKTGEEVDYNATNNKHGERRTLFVVSVPALNEWSKEFENNCNPQTTAATNLATTNGIQKRPAPDDMEVDAPVEEDSPALKNNLKRHCVEERPDKAQAAKTPQSLLSAEYLLNSPLPDRPSMACMVKVYEDFDAFTLNSLVDFIGFLSVDPTLDLSTATADDEFENTEMRAQHPPPSLIPRLHAIAIRMMPHANPLLDQSLQPNNNQLQLPSTTGSVYKDLLVLFKLCLFDDDIAAEYLLSHLISTVHSRSDLESIGKFTLNICNLPKQCLELYTKNLYNIIELLLPASHYLPMMLDTMNTASFAPKKDYETNKLVSGILQLAPHTHLVLDETRMHQGKLEANGVQGIQHLANLIKNQQLKCDFQYYHIDYNVNIPVLILSEGRSMLPSDFIIPLNADDKSIELIEESLKAAHHYLQPARLQQFRTFLTTARLSEFNVSEELTEIIQDDFVTMRKQNVKSNADDLHALLVLSRLLGIARGKAQLDKETWQLATEFEAKRRQRLQALPKSSTSASTI